MDVRYNRMVSVLLLAIGLLCVLLGLWLLALGEFSPAVIAGLAPALIGGLQLTRPYFQIYQGVVVVPALIGPAKRRFEFASLRLEGGKLFAVRPDGTRKRVPVAKWISHQADWTAALAGVR